MKNFNQFLLILIALVSMNLNTKAQSGLNTTLVGQFSYPDAGLSDIWGYASNNQEYALVCVDTKISVVDITIPANMEEVYAVELNYSFWRDIKTWGNYAYAVDDQGGAGLIIIDLSELPETASHTIWTGGGVFSFTTAHNIFIDENGFAYLVGSTYGVGGAVILDLNQDPINPPIVGYYDERYIHDCYVRGDTMWSAEINDGRVSIVDMSDKMNPQVLGFFNTPDNFSHNCWLSDDGQTLFTTDEVGNAYVGAYDVSDVTNVVEIDRVQSSPGENVIPHNTFVRGDYVITSYYRDGVTIHDATYPNNLIEVGNYDTSSEFTGNGFNGSWGVYPYLPSGRIIASDMEEGLFVIDPTYLQACYLEGQVTDASTGNPIPNAFITIQESGVNATSDFSGTYVSGQYEAGFYTLEVNSPGYETTVVDNVLLGNSLVMIQDIEMIPLESYTVTGTIVGEDWQPLPNAQVKIVSALWYNWEVNATTDDAGNFEIPSLFASEYNVYAGAWGHQTGNVYKDFSNTNSIFMRLDDGYYDDFFFDYEWEANDGTPVGGIWEQVVPIEYGLGGFTFSPANDAPNDYGNLCYVTGNSQTFDFVNGGTSILTSPVFDLTAYGDAWITYQSFFVSISQSGVGLNDHLTISISNGTETAVLDDYTTPTNGWVLSDYRIEDYIDISDNMQLIVEVSADANQEELTDAAFDAFKIYDVTGVVGISESLKEQQKITVQPNPFTEQAIIDLSSLSLNTNSNNQLSIFDLTGKELRSQKITNDQVTVERKQLPAGVYFYQVVSDNATLHTGKLMIQR